MSDIQIMQDQVDGLIANGKKLREKEAIFLKVQGINETIVKTELERETTIKEIAEAKEKKKKLVEKKNNAVATSAKKIIERMNSVLPIGKAVFDCADDLVIGWKVGKTAKPYNGLSGGEKQIFDAALAHVLNANIIVLEAAELDNKRLLAALEDLATIDKQVIVNTCHPVDVVPDPFVKVELDEVAA